MLARQVNVRLKLMSNHSEGACRGPLRLDRVREKRSRDGLRPQLVFFLFPLVSKSVWPLGALASLSGFQEGAPENKVLTS